MQIMVVHIVSSDANDCTVKPKSERSSCVITLYDTEVQKMYKVKVVLIPKEDNC